MENQTLPETQPQVENTPPVGQELPPQPVQNNRWLLISLVFFSLVAISLAGFFGYKYYQKEQVAEPTPTPDSIVMKEKVPIPTLDPTGGWKTYTNKTHGVSFKYPTTWALEENIGTKENNQVFNTKVQLSKGEALIEMYFNMDGIGGQPREYVGNKYVLDGHDLYKFNTIQEYDDRKKVGISNSLTTLGVFMIDDITYMIHLSYPNNTNEIEESGLLAEFDKILSTFEFLDNSNDSAQQLPVDSASPSLPVVVFEPPLSSDSYITQREELQEKVVDPFVDYYKQFSGESSLVSLSVQIQSNENINEQYPYSLTGIMAGGATHQEALLQSGGVLDWWLPTCMNACDYSDEFIQKYPQIVSKTN